ncbi:MAG TPA: prolyl oligopeptidase family serine peptidase [Thermoanaerobaculia bacterium]
MEETIVRRFVILLLATLSVLPAAADEKYEMPPAELAALVDAPPTPAILVGPADFAILGEPPLFLTIADLAQPELKLAGLRFNPRNHEQTRAPYHRDLRVLQLSTGDTRALSGLPSPLRARNTMWAANGKSFAFTNATEDALELWAGDAVTAKVWRVGTVTLNATVPSKPFHWLGNDSFVVRLAAPPAAAPADSRVPAGPIVQENLGRKTPARTYQDLLKTPYDESLFEHHAQSRLAIVTLTGDVKQLGSAGPIAEFEPSPDGNFLLVQTLHRPYSYVVPQWSFPRRIEVWDRDGKVVRQIADLPLADNVPTDFDAVPEGVRDATWRADKPATVTWLEALDKGNPRAEAAQRDRVLMLAAPFTGDPVTLVTLALRADSVAWASDDLAVVEEFWWKTRKVRRWRVRPGSPSTAPELLSDRSSEDRYSDPGKPMTRMTPSGTFVLRTANNGRTIFLNGEGASSEGDRPFVDAYDLAAKKATRLWQSAAPHYEYAVQMLDDGRTIVTRRESIDQPPNFHVRDLRTKASRALTNYPHPTPQLAGAKKELIRYKRADGVDLTATLYTPPGYDATRDGRLPVLMWAYPQEFKSASAAGQVQDSPYRFIRVNPMTPLPWLLRGYAIVDNPSMPIIGEGDREPNDTYVEQLVSGAQAIIDEVVRRGVGDRARMAVGGHSYGAFMAANLLAHSDLFRAGVARSGAYNRTLTPFSFQAEERTFWEAPETYMRMSPFTHAQKINEPLLLIHGVDDNNTGTFPIQSERLFAAMKGLGGTARLVMLPYESHGYRARESVLHMMWETDRWLERYVKGGGGK